MTKTLGYWGALVLLGACAAAAPTNRVQTYQPSTVNFANPERGFYQQEGIMGRGTVRSPLGLNALTKARAEGISTLRLYIMIDEFLDSAITADALSYLQTEFNKARVAGLKIIPRFTYTYPEGGTYPYTDPDAPLTRVLEHLGQLEPLLRDNTDIIAYLEAGFVGAWGEWHSSTNQLVSNSGINDASRAIVNRLLEVLPATRMIAMRYPPHKQQLFSNTPLTAFQAFDGTNQARVGAHNDCFLASKTDWGTYPENATAREALKTFLEQDNRYLPQGGETCNANTEAQPFIGCANALKDLSRLKYSSLNRGYQLDVYALWQTQGCLEKIQRQLGYRFELQNTSAPDTTSAGSSFNLEIQLRNTGFAAPYNPRGLEVLLRNKNTGVIMRQTILKTRDPIYDPRFWLPEQNTITLQALLQAPEAGTYEVFLALPDPLLATRADYAIQLANTNVWDAIIGANKLREIKVQ